MRKIFVTKDFILRDKIRYVDNPASQKSEFWVLKTFLEQFFTIIRRRTRVWALAPKPESVDASFRFFPWWWGLKSWGPTTKSIFFFLSLIRCLVKFVVLESHSHSLWVLNQYHITINTHLLSHIATFCLSLYFVPKRNLSHCCFYFHSSDLQQYN